MFWVSGVITDHETPGMQHTRSLRHSTHPVRSTPDHYIQHIRYAAHQIITFNTPGMQHTRSLRQATHPLTCPRNILKTYASSVSLLNKRGTEKNPHNVAWIRNHRVATLHRVNGLLHERKCSVKMNWGIGRTRPNLLKKLSTKILKASQNVTVFNPSAPFPASYMPVHLAQHLTRSRQPTPDIPATRQFLQPPDPSKRTDQLLLPRGVKWRIDNTETTLPCWG